MTLTADDIDDDDETPESGDKDVNNMDDHDSFDKTDETNIILSALYWTTRARTSSPAGAKNWFEAVNVKFAIANIRQALTYTEIFTA